MVSLRHTARPSALPALWVLFLLAPCAWVAALSILFSLTNEVCMGGSRIGLWWTAVPCLALATAPGLLASVWRRGHAGSDAAGERARFMLDVAMGGSVLFTLVIALSAVPIALLDTCRT